MFALPVSCVILCNPSTSPRPRPKGPFWTTHCRGLQMRQTSKCIFFFLLSVLRKFPLFFFFLFGDCLNQKEGLNLAPGPQDAEWEPVKEWTTASIAGNQEQNGCAGIIDLPDNSVSSLPLEQRIWSERHLEPSGNPESDKGGMEK